MRLTSLCLLLTIFLVGIGSAQLAGQTLQREVPPEFKSDGCSKWPDGDYRVCCEAHDRDYFFGGTKAERMASDKRLYKCVRDKGNKVSAILMLIGVRFGAVSWLPSPFRWGFGKKVKRHESAKQAASTNGTN